MTLRDLATCPATTCTPTMSVREVARVMAMADVGFVVVVDDERPVGVVTDRDIVLRAVATGHAPDTPVSEVMTRHAAHVGEHDTVEHAATVMADKQVRRLAVTAGDGRVVGVVSLDDLLRVAGSELEQLARAVQGARHAYPSIP